jgi:hypothetical protein
VKETDLALAGSEVSFQFYVTTTLSGQISNDQLIIIINLIESNSLASSTSNATEAQISNQQKASFMPQVPKTSNNSQNVNPFFKPAWIADISTLGLLTVNFYHGLYVPDFANTSN